MTAKVVIFILSLFFSPAKWIVKGLVYLLKMFLGYLAQLILKYVFKQLKRFFVYVMSKIR